jgi:hypothetical protein
MKRIITPLLAILVLTACSAPKQEIELDAIGKQLVLLDENLRKEISMSPENERGQVKVVPRNIETDGSLRVVPGGDWTSGFYPGTLWYMYELSGMKEFRELATAYTWLLEEQQTNGSNHDVGFRMYCSFGNALRLTGDAEIKPVLIQSAKTLIARYYETVGCIRSWDFKQEVWQCPVIIDNMMNLELLFWVSEETGDPVYRDIAVSHALTTMEHQFREDFSSVHVVDYDTLTGEVRQKNTHQGYSDESSWARGQSWGLYGYTMTYRFTKDERFLRLAEGIADFLLSHPRLPEDGVPYWDFDAPGIPDEPRDVSAAAIMISAFYELSSYSDRGEYFKSEADRILQSIWENYRSAPGENHGFILGHSTGHMPHGLEIDVSINYADYYFMEALNRKHDLEKQ